VHEWPEQAQCGWQAMSLLMLLLLLLQPPPPPAAAAVNAAAAEACCLLPRLGHKADRLYLIFPIFKST